MGKSPINIIKERYLPTSTKSNFKDVLLDLIKDFINDVEINWDYYSIRYETVMNEKEWDDFVNHPERKPYQSKLLKGKSVAEKYDYIIEFLTYLYPYYKSLRKSEFKNKLKLGIATLIDSTVNGRYTVEEIRMADTYVGRSEKQRDSGKIDPTPQSLSRLEYALREYSAFTGKDLETLRSKFSRISQGRLDLLVEYYVTCDVDTDLRKDIRSIFRILGRDLTLSFYEIKLGWDIWKDMRRIGLDTEEFLKLWEFPNYSSAVNKLLEFQNNKSYIKELEKHMEDDLPECYEGYKEKGFIKYHDFVDEEARRKKYPKNLRTIDEIEKMVQDANEEVLTYFPLVKNKSPRTILLNPIHPASTSRAFQSSVKNIKGRRVNTIVMTPRTEMIDEYLPILAHEATHALHKLVLEMGELSGVLEKGSSERVPSSVMEDFSQLVEDQFHSDKNLPYKKKFTGKEFPNFRSGYVQRFQVPYSLVQLGVRKYFDRLWNEGYRDSLTDEMVWEIKCEFDPKVKEWATLGLDVRRDIYDSLNYFSATDPDDGLTYMKKYVVNDTSQRVKAGMEGNEKSEALANMAKKKKQDSMSEAFEKKFGKRWVEDKDAIATLLWLLLESGRNSATETFSDLIINGNIKDYLIELKKIGIKESQI